MINLLTGEAIVEKEQVKTEEKDSINKVDSPFEWLKSINKTKSDLRSLDPTLAGFSTFMTNRGLMQSIDTVQFANMMNKLPKIPKEMVYLFYLNAIPKNYKYAKWSKSTHGKNIDKVIEKTGLSKIKSIECIHALSDKQLKKLISKKRKNS